MRPWILLLALLACKGDDKASDTGGVDEGAGLVMSPRLGGQGTSLQVELDATDSFFNFEGALTADFGEGFVVDSMEVSDGWNATADITIEPDAALGTRDVTIDMDGRSIALDDGFEVISQSFTLDPARGRMGETVEVTFLGNNTDWTSGLTWPTFGDDVEVLNFTVLSESLATGDVVIESDAIPGLRDVTMTEGGSALTLYDGFTVDRVGVAATFDPAEIAQGDTVSFTIVGRDTNFDSSTTLTFYDEFGENPDIELVDMTVLDAQNLSGRITASNAAGLGWRDVLVSTDDEGVLIPDAVEVVGGDYDLTDVAISLTFYVARAIDNNTGEISESVVASCAFVIPLDPGCPDDPEDDGSECTNGTDDDEDGYVDCLDSDCGNSGVCPSPSPYDVQTVIESPGNGEEDCPTPRTVGAGDHVWLESGSNIVTLDRFEDSASGLIYYAGVDLTMDDYVPGERYDLHTEGEEGGVAEYVLDEVLYTVPADWSLVSPELWNNYTHSRAEDFQFQWTPAMTYPDAMFIASLSGTLSSTGTSGSIASIPWDDGDHSFTAEEVQELTAGPSYFTAYSIIKGPYFGLPDSIYQSNQAKSYIYLQGYLVLE